MKPRNPPSEIHINNNYLQITHNIMKATHNTATAKRKDRKAMYKFIFMVVLAGIFSFFTDSNFWGWLAVIFFGRFIFTTLLSIAIGIIVYFLTWILVFASVIGGFLWIITS